MLKPQTISEQMQYSTVRLATSHGSGTGFFFEFAIDGDQKVPVIVTNRHVLNNNKNEKVAFFLHSNDGGAPGKEKVNVRDLEVEWYFHPEKDLCFCFVAPLLRDIEKKLEKSIYYIPIDETIIWDNNRLESLSAIEDVVMVGYPTGLWDIEKFKLTQEEGVKYFRSFLNEAQESEEIAAVQ